MIDLALSQCEVHGLSTWHCNFVTAEDAEALEAAGLLARGDWQFHWRNEDYADFDGFLSRLRSRKRKNILRERRQVSGAGVVFTWLRGSELQATDLEFVFRCYGETFRQYGNHAALNRTFFAQLAEGLGDRLVVARADRDDEPVAMSLYLEGGGRLYGRYWGCIDSLPALHFDTAYYQGIEFCIRNGLRVFESGAQGEHKIARGFLPAATRSYHYLRDTRFREAIAHFLERERGWLDEYREQIAPQDPFRRDLE